MMISLVKKLFSSSTLKKAGSVVIPPPPPPPHKAAPVVDIPPLKEKTEISWSFNLCNLVKFHMELKESFENQFESAGPSPGVEDHKTISKPSQQKQ